ncbi:hypothetical protein [Staphylococcus canis]|uniref:Uncharacterized protein n=1 Tax=Staphylococcus canis TaxID=2724942 RepID=A0ABS0TAM2_9STAP|nr:hypothetical protein [Staphylococcus canis]MBI5975782.1 hypothetical protein [Staphylococcus canis]
MIIIWIIGLIIAFLIVVGVFKRSHWMFNVLAALFTFLLLITDILLYGWHNESIKISILCLIVITFEFAHVRIKMLKTNKHRQ